MNKNKSWSSTITITFADIGHECETEEEYIEYVKETFIENHDLYLNNNEIYNIEFSEVK